MFIALAIGWWINNENYLGEIQITSETQILSTGAMVVTAVCFPILFYTGYLLAKRTDR